MTGAATFDVLIPPVSTAGRRYLPMWSQSRLRVRNPMDSVTFYEKHFGFKMVLKKVASPRLVEYHLVTMRSADKEEFHAQPNPETLLSQTTALVLCHFTDAESDAKINNGNESPFRNFGHIAVNCNDVYESCRKLEAQGVSFRKRPDEGRMKGLAFALDPDGYWIEICSRGSHSFPEEFNFSQTMIRIKDPKVSIPFYRDVLGMTLVREMHMSDFSNYFLASLSKREMELIESNASVAGKQASSKDYIKELWGPCLELTFNHGTDTDADFQYHPPSQPPRGFEGLSFQVSTTLAAFIEECRKTACTQGLPGSSKFQIQQQACDEGTGPLACVMSDPDGYPVIVRQSDLS